MEQFDVIIVGAGPAGCATAIALLAFDYKVALIHKPPSPIRYQIGESATPSVGLLLKRLGLPYHLESMGHSLCYGSQSLWGSHNNIGEQDYIFRGEGYGWHLDRAAFDCWLRKEAKARGAVLFSPMVFIKAGICQNRQWGIRIRDPKGNNNQNITAPAVVDASGRAALLAKQMGATRCDIDALTAISCVLESSKQNTLSHFSLVESHPMGWFYAATIPSGKTVAAFMSDADLIKTYKLADKQNFHTMLTESKIISRYIISPQKKSTITIYPAYSAYLNQVAGHGWIAVGDAALSMDPLTSSGINCALADGIAAATAIHDYLNGNIQPLKAYTEHMNATVRDYLQERQSLYSREMQWPDREFWLRR